MGDNRRRKRPELYKCQPFRWRVEVPVSPLGGKDRPKGRSGHRIVYHNGCFYSFGGYNPEIKISDPDLLDDPHWKNVRPLFKELWRYNVNTKKWTKLSVSDAASDQLASHSAVIYGNKLLVYGGTGMPFGLSTSTNLYLMDLDSLEWHVVDPSDSALSDVPPSLYGQAVVLHKGHIYTVGGTSGNQYFMAVHRLNLSTKKWQVLYNSVSVEEDPPSRYRHELCVYNNRILVFGGGTSFTSFPMDTIPAFNLESLQWESIHTTGHKSDSNPDDANRMLIETFPPARRCHNLVNDEQYVYLFGGFDGDRIFSGVWRLTLETMAWTRLPNDLPKAVYFGSACLTESGKAYSFGGVTEVEGVHRTRKVYSAWLKIPSLRGMCWEAINHYAPGLDKKSTQTLLKEGLPRDLINQVKEGHVCPG